MNKIYDKEITKLLELQEMGQNVQSYNQSLLKEYLSAKDQINETEKIIEKQSIQSEQQLDKIKCLKLKVVELKKELEDLDLNPELEILKIKRQEVERIISLAQKEAKVQEIDQNILKIDNNLKRRIQDFKKKISTIKKWVESNKQIVDFKLRENGRCMHDFNSQIKDKQNQLNLKILKIEQQKEEIQRLIYDSTERQIDDEEEKQLIDTISDVPRMLIKEEIQEKQINNENDEDRSNFEAAEQLLKELNNLRQSKENNLQGGNVKYFLEEDNDPDFLNDMENDMMIFGESKNKKDQKREDYDVLQQNSSNLGADKVEQTTFIQIEEKKKEIKLRKSQEQNKQVNNEDDSIRDDFEIEYDNGAIKSLRNNKKKEHDVSNHTYHIHQNQEKQRISKEELKIDETKQSYINPLQRMKTGNKNNVPKSMNPLMSASENAMRGFEFKKSVENQEKLQNLPSNNQQQELRQSQESSKSKLKILNSQVSSTQNKEIFGQFGVNIAQDEEECLENIEGEIMQKKDDEEKKEELKNNENSTSQEQNNPRVVLQTPTNLLMELYQEQLLLNKKSNLLSRDKTSSKLISKIQSDSSSYYNFFSNRESPFINNTLRNNNQ